jgi:hypothetical protein
MTVFTIETLNALGARLLDHADSITNVARHDMEVDVRLAGLFQHGDPPFPHRRDSRCGVLIVWCMLIFVAGAFGAFCIAALITMMDRRDRSHW